ncbi:hypothetical protein IFR05_002419, partial [Cadophora sp. M221]
MKLLLHASFSLALVNFVVAQGVQAPDESVFSSVQFTTQVVTDVRTSVYPLTTWVSTVTDARGSSFVVSSIGPGTVPVELPTASPSSATSSSSTPPATSLSSSTAKGTLPPISPIESSSTSTASPNNPVTTTKVAAGVYTTTAEVTSTISACIDAGRPASECMTTYTTTEIKTQKTTVYVTTTLDTTSSCATTSGIPSCSSVTRTNVVTVTSLLPLGTAIATTQLTVPETVIATFLDNDISNELRYLIIKRNYFFHLKALFNILSHGNIKLTRTRIIVLIFLHSHAPKFLVLNFLNIHSSYSTNHVINFIITHIPIQYQPHPSLILILINPPSNIILLI